MKIGTFNLRDLFEEGHQFRFYAEEVTYTADFIQRRIDSIATTIRKIDADILFLQEVASEKVLARIVAQTKLQYSTFVGGPDRRGIANAALYRLADCSCSTISTESQLPVFVEGDEDLYGTRINNIPRREFIRLETTYRDLPLTLIGVHLKATTGMAKRDRTGKTIKLDVVTQIDAADSLIRSALTRLSQARKLREVADALFAKEGNAAQAVILGDFNALEYAELLRIIKGELEESPTTLFDACDEIPERKRYSHIKLGKKRLIDHILVSRSVQQLIRAVAILNKKLRDQTTETAGQFIVESDHAPIVMELR
jgi:endonuclease/exonuclease/phosphatase family metal-dependent hydrolase